MEGGMPMGLPGPGQGMPGGMGGYERIFPCVKLRGLPFDVTEEDIRMFVVGINALDLVWLERSGEAPG